jgi:hypothetical protein
MIGKNEILISISNDGVILYHHEGKMGGGWYLDGGVILENSHVLFRVDILTSNLSKSYIFKFEADFDKVIYEGKPYKIFTFENEEVSLEIGIYDD